MKDWFTLEELNKLAILSLQTHQLEGETAYYLSAETTLALKNIEFLLEMIRKLDSVARSNKQALEAAMNFITLINIKPENDKPDWPYPDWYR